MSRIAGGRSREAIEKGIKNHGQWQCQLVDGGSPAGAVGGLRRRCAGHAGGGDGAVFEQTTERG
jgi:hypothetical protein